MQNAGLPRQEKSPATMRRLFGSCGGAGRQDVLITEESDGHSVRDRNREARVTYKKVRRQGVGKKRKNGFPKASGDKVKGRGQTPNGFNRRTGTRNGRYRRDSEYHLAPERPCRDAPMGDRSPPPAKRSMDRKLS